MHWKKHDGLGWVLLDFGAYLASRARSFSQRIVDRLRRRRRILRLLRGAPAVAGRVVCARPITAPLSGERVAACRLVVEAVQDNGSWAVVFDETRLGEVELRCSGARAPLEAPAILLREAGASFAGAAVHDALGGQLGAGRHADLQATEYLLRHGDEMHVFGMALVDVGAARPEAPYRAAPVSMVRDARARTVVISAWPRAELLRETQRRDDLLPPL